MEEIQEYAKHIARWILSTFFLGVSARQNVFIFWNHAEKRDKGVLKNFYEEVTQQLYLSVDIFSL